VNFCIQTLSATESVLFFVDFITESRMGEEHEH